MQRTHFLNVDLDIYSNRDLHPLVKRLGRKVIVLHLGRERGQFSAHLEQNIVRGRTADSAIRAFCRLIEKLPPAERVLWNTAAVRSFSIGIQAGARPNPRDFTIRPKTVQAVSAVGADIVITIYAPENGKASQE